MSMYDSANEKTSRHKEWDRNKPAVYLVYFLFHIETSGTAAKGWLQMS